VAYSATIVADSVSEQGHRLTTIEVTFPRLILAEFNTHRVFSRNSASSRAIPFAKQVERIVRDPFIPIYWGVSRSGMQATQELDETAQETAKMEWLRARGAAVAHAMVLNDLRLHKQLINRILEPYMWHTVIVTATEWDNFFALRANPDAQPEIRVAAEMMQAALAASKPQKLSAGHWHLPLIQDDEREWAVAHPDEAIKVSAGRCARVSYLTHDGKRDHSKDIELYMRLTSSGHMSPLEHVARPMTTAELKKGEWSGNFRGWHQHRKDVLHEENFAEVEKT